MSVVARAAYGATAGLLEARPPREISAGLRRLVLLYVWITIASSAIVFSEPALYDVLMRRDTDAAVGLVDFSRGLGLYLLMWVAIVAGGFIATTQAGIFDVPLTHMGSPSLQ